MLQVSNVQLNVCAMWQLHVCDPQLWAGRHI